MVDHKSRDASLKGEETHWQLRSQSDAVASTSERKLSVELPSSRQIYTIGSTVTGLVHLGTKNRDTIQEVQVSLVCVVRSRFYRYNGGATHDVRHETNNLLHQDQTLWTRGDGDVSDPPAEFSFQITVPEFGNDVKAKDPEVFLPPSFHADEHHGWKNVMTYRTPIGFVKYHIKASVVRKGAFKLKERAFCPFVFLPPSPPPPLLPMLPEIISVPDLDRMTDLWHREDASTNLHHGVFSSRGQATLTLLMPNVSSIPRLISVPFILCLNLQTRHMSDISDAEPPSDVMPPPPQLDKASMHLRQSIQSCARGGVQHHSHTFDKQATDNLLYGITPQEDTWILKKQNGKSYWEKGYIWRGLWKCEEVPNFANRQLTWKYALVAEVPIKGLGNAAKLVSQDLEVSSGITGGSNPAPTSEENMLDLPPDYFDIEGLNRDEGDEDDGEDYDMDKKKR